MFIIWDINSSCLKLTMWKALLKHAKTWVCWPDTQVLSHEVPGSHVRVGLLSLGVHPPKPLGGYMQGSCWISSARALIPNSLVIRWMQLGGVERMRTQRERELYIYTSVCDNVYFCLEIYASYPRIILSAGFSCQISSSYVISWVQLRLSEKTNKVKITSMNKWTDMTIFK